jgi:hypothetical protein
MITGRVAGGKNIATVVRPDNVRPQNHFGHEAKGPPSMN